MTTYTKNLVTDYTAPTDGTSDATAAFNSFTAFLVGLTAGDDVTLTVPNAGAGGANTYILNDIGQSAAKLAKGILGGLTVTINGTGVTISDGGGVGYTLSSGVLDETNLRSSRINTVSAGATTIQLKTPSEHSRYAVNGWILVTGIDLQGGGIPINPAFCEYVKVTSKNTVAGTITFTPALVNSYKDTWPVYDGGSASSADHGGAATIYAPQDSWDIDLTINGITFSRAAQLYVSARKITLNNCVSTGAGGFGFVPTICREAVFNGCDQSAAAIEVDKVNQYLTYSVGSVHSLTFQSMSVVNVRLTNFTVVAFIAGTGRNLTIDSNCIIPSLAFGCNGYGSTTAVTASDSTVSAVTFSSGTNQQDVVGNGFTMSGGIIRRAKSGWGDFGNGAIRFAVPGAWCFFSGQLFNENYTFQILDVWDDATYTYIQTTLSGGFPVVPLTTGQLHIYMHPCPLWVGTNLAGCVDVVDLSQGGAQRRPINSYSKRTYAGTGLQATPTHEAWGRIFEINVNVSHAYTGGQASMILNVLGPVTAQALSVDRTTTFIFNPQINLKVSGARQITRTGAISLSGDTLSSPGDIWLAGLQRTLANHDDIGDAVVSVEIITDQELVDVVLPSTKHIRQSRMISHFQSTDWVFVR